VRTVWLAILLCGACAAAGPGAPSSDDTSGDGGTTCTLGTPDHCGRCNNACPVGDPSRTRATCSDATPAGACGLVCLGDAYDFDGKLASGCEAVDTRHDTAATALAITLPDVTGGTGACTGGNNPCTVVEQILSDVRDHENAPIARPLGVEDWFRVTAAGEGTPQPMKACLSVGNFPVDNRVELCISDGDSMMPTACGVAIGGLPSVCVSPTDNPNSGTFYVRVRKQFGTATANGYALYLEH